jgi:hypothetical protein
MPAGEQSGLLTHTATTETVLLCAQLKGSELEHGCSKMSRYGVRMNQRFGPGALEIIYFW